MSSPTCHHVKEDGTFCASSALQGRQYCYFHLTHRARRLRRALALSRNEPCPLVLPPLENLGSIQVALSETVQALAAGQLDQRTGGRILYAIQQATTVFLRLAQMKHLAETTTKTKDDTKDDTKMEAPQAAADDAGARLQEYPEFERNFDLPPGIDLDAETDHAMRGAQEQAAVLSIMPSPQPASGCPVPAKAHYAREEAYQTLQWEVHFLRKQVREFQEQRNQEFRKKQPAPADTLPKALSDSA